MFPFPLLLLLQILLSLLLGGAVASELQETVRVLDGVQLQESFDTTVGQPLLLGEDMLQDHFGLGHP